MTSLWRSTAALPEFPTLSGDARTDVLIIGGGITGLLTAHLLHQKGVPYILVEQGRICGGTTGADTMSAQLRQKGGAVAVQQSATGQTTAKITVQHGLIYDKLLHSSKEKAQMYLSANQAAFEELARLCSGIDCDFERRDNFVYSTDRSKLEAELKALQRLRCKAGFCEKIPLPVEAAGAVCVPHQAQFHPLKFLAEIAKDLHIFELTKVLETVGTTAVTNHGRIHAKCVVVATHFPFLNKHGSYFVKLYQHRSYVLALENAADVNGMYVSDSKTGLSFRNHGKYLLLGGGGHRTGEHGGCWEELRSFAAKNYPNSVEKFHWAAQDCMSLDSVPYIGNYSASTPNLYVASGFNKWGMTGSMLSAMLLCDLICGKRSEFSEVFSPSRSILKPQLLINGFEATKNLLTPTAKRCPHLGCALKWNAAEHSWDCACHGSRFAENGKVLDNPANGDLKK